MPDFLKKQKEKKQQAPWITKYSPLKINEIINQKEQVKQIRDFIENFSKKKKKALMLYGPTGTGKTCSIIAIANELGYELLEINASDTRNAENIDSIIGNASKQMSLFSKGKVILVDEIDGISGNQDRGGIPALAKIIESSLFPLIMTLNDIEDKKFAPLKKISECIVFQPLGYEDIFNKLKQIVNEEKIKVDENSLKSLAIRAGGDMRAAINDLQNLSQSGKFDKEMLETLSERNRDEPIQSAITRIFKTTDEKIAMQALENVEEELDEVIKWLDWNLPFEYTKKEELWKAYDKLSRADVFNGRIKRWQHWRFLVYVSALISGGIALAKQERYKNYVQYVRTMRLLKIWQMNQKFYWRKSISEKLAQNLHISKKKAVQTTVPYLKYIIKQNPRAAEELELEKEELEWLKK